MSMNYEGSGASYSPNPVPTSHSPSLPAPTPQRRQAHEVFEKIMKGRKSWKTLRDGDLVWPEELERALVEGLEAYQPDDSRETRILGRFPRRNRFISEYIFKVTGKRRTAKQVGSRLQQLRETSGGKELLSLLCPPHGDPTRASSSPRSFHSESSTPTSPTSSVDNQLEMDIPERVVVSIYLIPASPYDPPSPGRCACTVQPSSGTPSSPSMSEQQWGSDYQSKIFRPSLHPRHILCIDPNVSFTSLAKLDSAVSYFQVMVDDSTVHEEVAPLLSQPTTVPTNDGRHQYLYSTPLVPTFWQTLCQSSDPTRYTIFQQVASSHQSSSRIYFSAVYKFSYPATASPPTTASSPLSAVPSELGSYQHLPYSISRRSDRSSSSQSYNSGTYNPYAGSGHGEEYRHTTAYGASYVPPGHDSLSNNLLSLPVFGSDLPAFMA